MVKFESYKDRVRGELARVRDTLAPLEAGEMRTGEKRPDGVWADTTAKMVAFHKRSIETFEAIFKALDSQAQAQVD